MQHKSGFADRTDNRTELNRAPSEQTGNSKKAKKGVSKINSKNVISQTKGFVITEITAFLPSPIELGTTRLSPCHVSGIVGSFAVSIGRSSSCKG